MENNIDHIERFFSGEMNQSEIAEFEKRKSVDKEFAKEVLLFRRAKEIIRAGAGRRMKHHLDDLGHKELTFTMIDTYIRFNLLKKYWYVVAASVLVIIGLGYFAYHSFISEKSLPTFAQLYDSYYEVPKVDLVISRGDKAEGTMFLVWNSALEKYSEIRYEAAIEDFREVLQNSAFPHTSAANFYLGICYLNINLPDSAVARFSNVSPTSSLTQDAGWYIGLSYLKAGNLQRATEVFKHIAALPKHYKKEQAKEILESLSRMK